MEDRELWNKNMYMAKQVEKDSLGSIPEDGDILQVRDERIQIILHVLTCTCTCNGLNLCHLNL